MGNWYFLLQFMRERQKDLLDQAAKTRLSDEIIKANLSKKHTPNTLKGRLSFINLVLAKEK